MLEARPGAVVPLAGEPCGRSAGSGARGDSRDRTRAWRHRRDRCRRRPRAAPWPSGSTGAPGQHRRRALGEAARPAPRRSAEAREQLAAGVELGRRSARVHSVGRPAHRQEPHPQSRAPPLAAGSGSSGPRKNIEPPAPEPAALPPSAPAARIAAPSRSISGVHMAGSSACWCRQFSSSSAPTCAEVAGHERLRHARPRRRAARAARRDRAVAALVRLASPGSIVLPEKRDAPV